MKLEAEFMIYLLNIWQKDFNIPCSSTQEKGFTALLKNVFIFNRFN